MVTRGEIVVTLDGELVAANHPVARVDDPMFVRGDGVFETLLVRDGRACLLDAHLERLARSASMVGLAPVAQARWRAAGQTAAAAWTAPGEAVLRMVLGRGRGDEQVGFVSVTELPARAQVARRDGVPAVTLDRGVVVGARAAPPWSIAGVKSMSYALNAAALRHAERLGVGDVVLVSADGFVLEGPRSSVVIATADGELLTPPTTLPILPGTTVRAVFDVVRQRGRTCGERPLKVADLLAAQGVWLLSSVTLAARLTMLDGIVLPTPIGPLDMAAVVDEAVESPA